MSEWTAFPPTARTEIVRRQREIQAYCDGVLAALEIDTAGQNVTIDQQRGAYLVEPLRPPVALVPPADPAEMVAGV